MLRLYVRYAHRPRLLLFLAAAANLAHPLIHGTPLDGGALDSCLLALDGAALCSADHR
jgi:hypothetical protein